MNKLSHRQIWVALAAVGGLATASMGGVAIAQQPSSSPARLCEVSVDTSASQPTYQVVRQEFKDGRCVCAVTTTANQDASVQGRIASLLRSKTCENAPSVAMGAQSGSPGVSMALGLGASAAILGGVIKSSNAPVSP